MNFNKGNSDRLRVAIKVINYPFNDQL
jgi:hypothetical protein